MRPRALPMPLLLLLIICMACTRIPAPGGPGGDRSDCPADSLKIQPGDETQAAFVAARVGGAVCFEPGIYRLSQALRPLGGQTLVFRPGAVLNGSEIVTNWTQEGSYWISSGHHQSLSSSVTGLPDAIMCPSNPGACIYEDVFLDGRPLRQVQTLSALDEPDEVFFDKPTGHDLPRHGPDRQARRGDGGRIRDPIVRR